MIAIRRVAFFGALALTCALSIGARAQDRHAGHSLEQDEHDERAEGLEARRAAQVRLLWRDARWRQDPVVRIKLLGLNDFHGALSRRTVGPRPAGGAAVLASYLEAAAAQAEDGAFIIHA